MCWLLRREKQKRQGFSVFGFKVSFKHGFKGCLMPQDLCVSQTLCFWFISDFAFMGCSFFSFCMYMSIRMTEVWIWISPFMCVLVEMIDLWFFDQNMGFFFFFFFKSLVPYLLTKLWFLLLLRSMGSWFLEIGFVCFCHWYHIYRVFYFILYIKLLLRSIASWILAFIYQYIISVCVWKLCFFIVWSVSYCAGIVINVRPITIIDHCDILIIVIVRSFIWKS